MNSRDGWTKTLDDAANAVDASLGYHLVYGPWDTIYRAETAFVSANPGKRTRDGRDRMVSDERGNSFEVESKTTLSPLTAQFLKLCEFIGVSPLDVLTGTANPFRTDSEKDLTSEQRFTGTNLAHHFWSECFALGRLSRFVVSSDSARDIIISVTRARLIDEFPSNWGNTKIRKYTFSSDGVVVHLPQMSRYKLFSRTECLEPLERAFRQ